MQQNYILETSINEELLTDDVILEARDEEYTQWLRFITGLLVAAFISLTFWGVLLFTIFYFV